METERRQKGSNNKKERETETNIILDSETGDTKPKQHFMLLCAAISGARRWPNNSIWP